MAKDDELDPGEFSLEEILAEFATHHTGAAPPAQPPAPPAETPTPPAAPPRPAPRRKDARQPDARNWESDTIPFPVRPRPDEPDPGETDTVVRHRANITPFPSQSLPPQEPEPDKRAVQKPKRPGARLAKTPEPAHGGQAGSESSGSPDDTKVLKFPKAKPESPVAATLDRLRRQADAFAEHMYEDEGTESDRAVRRAERLIPGVDEEEPGPRERKPRPTLPPPPDLAPAELAKRYGRALPSLRRRRIVLLALFLLSLYLTLAEHLPLRIPTVLAASAALRCYALAALQAAAFLTAGDLVVRSLARPFQISMGMDLLVALSNVALLADALTLPGLCGGEPDRQPCCVAGVLSLLCLMAGDYNKRLGQRQACRTAAAASEPYLVTRDEGKWNGRDTYAKRSGPVAGFGSQIQTMDGAERIYQVFSPLVLLSSLFFAIISSLGRNRPQDLLWCLASILTAAAPLSASLCFGQPWRKLSARLSRSGAALAGWEGIVNTTGASNLLLYDADLFPPGSVSLNGIKIFGDFSAGKVISYTATVIRDSGSGLEKVFHDLLRAQGAVYRRGEDLLAHESGGLSETIRGEQVLVGSASFMAVMEVSLPQGLNIKNAVFCAIGGELAGIFALNYRLPSTVAPALDDLIRNHITPVLATRDFNLIPSMLRQRFKLPVERMEFPPVDRRRELSSDEQEHSNTLTAVLCREGIAPYSETMVGGKRLRSAVRLSALVTCAGSAMGALLAFYLTFVAAYASITPINLLVFLAAWLVPTFLISGWVNRY